MVIKKNHEHRYRIFRSLFCLFSSHWNGFAICNGFEDTDFRHLSLPKKRDERIRIFHPRRFIVVCSSSQNVNKKCDYYSHIVSSSILFPPLSVKCTLSSSLIYPFCVCVATKFSHSMHLIWVVALFHALFIISIVFFFRSVFLWHNFLN